jgi:3-phenylpropionate/cinnamic acid dioxygenase small subunit
MDAAVTPEEYRDIQLLLAGASLALDVDDADGYLACFTADGVFQTYGRDWPTGERLRQMLDAAPKGLHLGGVPAVERADEGGVRSRQNFLFVDRASGEQRTGMYTDDLVHGAGGWRIRRRRCQFYRADGPSDRP